MKSLFPMELPYNFDIRWIDFLYIMDPEGKNYDCIYLPPYWEDYHSAKYNYQGLYSLQNTMTREEYCEHVQYINDVFPGKVCLLLQQNKTLLDQQLLEQFYMPLGIKQFCVGSIEQAKKIKEVSSQFKIIASITMKLMPNELNSNQELKKYIDQVILFFPYNTHKDLVDQLPNDFRYVLLVNCRCDDRCAGTHHWFATREEELELIPKVCPNLNGMASPEHSMFINPLDLPKWKDKISVIKLQGREFPTEDLIMDFMAYNQDYEYYGIGEMKSI